MSLQARIFGLVLLPALLLVGCESDNQTIGLPPRDGNFSLNYYEHTLAPMHTLEDSVTNMASNRLIFGHFEDSYFGNTQAIAYSSMSAEEIVPPRIDEAAVVDSLVLHLDIDYIYGNSTDFLVDFTVYESLFVLDGENLYQSFQKQIQGNELASLPYTVPTDEFIENGRLQLDMQLDFNFATELLDQVREFNGNFEFPADTINAFISGLTFIAEPNSDGMIGFDLNSQNTRLVLYYSHNGINEQWQVNFATAADSQIELPEHYSYIKPNQMEPDRTGTALEGLNTFHMEFDTSDEYLYYRSGTGLGITTELADLQALNDTLENAIISTAVLEIEDVESPELQSVPPSLRVFFTDDSNDLVRYNNQIIRRLFQGNRSNLDELSDPNFLAQATEEFLVYDEEQQKYQADVTMYIQSFLEGTADLTKLWIYDIGRASVSRFRVPKENIKIKIYYTKVD